uniref:Peptidase A1 domain-containing protein n=1 Tax=Ditylenchus dipsaci TaxID=166011 RepID=A0A915E3E8_9BILA
MVKTRQVVQEIKKKAGLQEVAPKRTQTFVVDVDFWTSQDLSILDSKANLSKVQFGLPPKHVFYSNESSTFKVVPGNFSEGFYLNKGSLGNDVVQLGGLHLTNITFAQINQIAWRYNEEPIDGILGISPHISWQHIPSFLAQISDQLDQPIVSIFNDGNVYSNGSGQLTLGGEDLDNCQSN